ncbi:MAG: glycosyltransferase family 2 protein [Acidibrevibacterium sp.]|jgi:GT2 family glycosyltransferase|uniref:glycosyltransferase family 2 protein n=1 Tax=Acidibrevibacterium fodinaquatile TaxID=1969806 RepID=UPI0023A8639B|nr:glycosyltransferase family 2 protein [Acidibrevibacterium fodinaquatile]MCA7119243.1 glycosyltransferase family 2 protein [Acidibrevibacterium fodinaquatile]
MSLQPHVFPETKLSVIDQRGNDTGKGGSGAGMRRFLSLAEFSLACIRVGRALARRNRALGAVLRMVWRPVRRFFMPVFEHKNPNAYENWIAKYDRLLPTDRAAIAHHLEQLPTHPDFLLVMPADDVSLAAVRATLAALEAQLYPHWHMVIVARSSSAGHVQRNLERIVAADRRLRLITTDAERYDGSAEFSESCTASAARWLVPVLAGDILPPQALYECVAEINAHPAAELLYADEDRIEAGGRRAAPYFKPDFDPDLLLAQNYLSGLTAYHAGLIARIGGLPTDACASAWHEVVLDAAFAAGAAHIRHIPSVLCHRRAAATRSEREAAEAAAHDRAAVARVLARNQLPARVVEMPGETGYRIAWPLPSPAPLVSIIIPTRDRAELLERCLDGVLRRTDYPAIEVIIADNDSREPATAALYARMAQDARVRILPMPGPFNYSRLNNQAVAAARGEILLLLNNDIDVIAPGWLREMVSHALRPEIGAVGAKLLYADDTIQHAGVILGMGWPEGVAGHYYCNETRDAPGAFDLLRLVRSTSAVTAACLAVRTSVFLEVGGFDEENLTVAFNDVDLCLRIQAAGYRNLWTPFAELYHLESASRGKDLGGDRARRYYAEIAYMRARWGETLDQDPYWNPNLSLSSGARNLAPFPRRPKPWLTFPAIARPGRAEIRQQARESLLAAQD